MKSNTKNLGQCRNIDLPRNIDIEEVQASSENTEDVTIDGGEVEPWKLPEPIEKAKLRGYITHVILLFWIFWTVTGLVRFFVTGDVSLLIVSPVMISVPLVKMLQYYFGNN